MKNGEIHSEEWLTDARNYWWNDDYIELIIKRYNLKNVNSIADIGCGEGYMLNKLIPFLPQLKKAYALDIEKKHIEKAHKLSDKYHNISFEYLVNNAEKIDINSNSVDLVVCQTLLLHVANPSFVLQEMKRILKPGGTIMVIETNNRINSLIYNDIVDNDSDNKILDISNSLKRVEFDLIVQKGIFLLNEGNISIGDDIPKLFLKLGIKNIDVSILDKACSLIPPYDTVEKKSRAEELLGWLEDEKSEYNYSNMLKYYLAGGGKKKDFDYYWEQQKLENKEIIEAIKNEKYIMPGGALMYIVVGNK